MGPWYRGLKVLPDAWRKSRAELVVLVGPVKSQYYRCHDTRPCTGSR